MDLRCIRLGTGVREAEKPQGIVLRILNELMKVQEPGYKLYDKIVKALKDR
mgnify:CR=1 FL=1